MNNDDVIVVVLTGGPCGGKSSLLEALRERTHLGGRVLYFVPEAATILINDGLDPADTMRFQNAVLSLQLKLEGEALSAAHASGVPSVVVCDRGTMDGAAYCTSAQFDDIVAAHGYKRADMLFRYDLVVHLVSAAADVPDAYTTGNNEARFEDLDDAVALENKTLNVWSGHLNRLVLRGYASFADKLAAAMEAIESSLIPR